MGGKKRKRLGSRQKRKDVMGGRGGKGRRAKGEG